METSPSIFRGVSISTATTPWLPIGQLAPLVAAAGYSGIDIACRPSVHDPAKPAGWGNNAAILNLDAIETQTPGFVTALRDHGLVCPVLLSYASADEVETVQRLAESARTLGAGALRLSLPLSDRESQRDALLSQKSAWENLIANEAFQDLRFLIETHDKTLCSSVSAALRIIGDLPMERTGVIYDVANTAVEGSEPIEVCLALLGKQLAGIHIKDIKARLDENRWNGLRFDHVPPGEGLINWPAFMAALAQSGYRGWLTMENFTGFELGPERIVQDAAWLRALLGEQRDVSS